MHECSPAKRRHRTDFQLVNMSTPLKSLILIRSSVLPYTVLYLLFPLIILFFFMCRQYKIGWARLTDRPTSLWPRRVTGGHPCCRLFSSPLVSDTPEAPVRPRRKRRFEL